MLRGIIKMAVIEKFYYVVYVIQGEAVGTWNAGIIDIHPVDFVIENNNKIMILYSIEITKEQGDKLSANIQENKNVSN